MSELDLESWLKRHAQSRPSILLGAEDFPGGERSVFAHSPTHQIELVPGAIDALDEAFSSTRSGRGGWIGYLGYEFGLPLVHEPSFAQPSPPWPAGCMRYYPKLEWYDSSQIKRPSDRIKPVLNLQAEVSDAVHATRVEALRERLVAGDVYEANLTRRFFADRCDAQGLFLDLAQHAPAPYSAFVPLDCGTIVCNSPEGFLRLDPDGAVETFPIKGTRPRGADGVEDERLRDELRADSKELAEHLMVVDLLRNDLGRVCEPGTVTCGELFEVVAYPGVWHMVTSVRGQLPPGMGRAELLAATLPAGSITGAPKRAAVQNINRLEASPRGPYCGIILVAPDDGSLIANVVIRTALCSNERTLLQAGGGIVLDSDAQRECAETWLKLGNFAGES